MRVMNPGSSVEADPRQESVIGAVMPLEGSLTRRGRAQGEQDPLRRRLNQGPRLPRGSSR